MKNKTLWLAILLACLLLSMPTENGLAIANSDSGFVVGELGMYAFVHLKLPDYKATDFDHQGLFNWNMHIQVTYPIRRISPQLDLRLTEQTPDERRPGVFWAEMEVPNRQFKKVFMNFFSATTSLSFRQKITSNLDLSCSAGMSFLIFHAYLEVHDKISGENTVILNDKRRFFGPALGLEPHISLPISKRDNYEYSLYFSPKYEVVFTKITFRTIYFKAGIEVTPLNRNSESNTMHHFMIYLYSNIDLNSDIFRGETSPLLPGIGLGGFFWLGK